MIVTMDQQLAAHVLMNRAHNKLFFEEELILSPEQIEFDTFYHYILSQLALELVKSTKPQKSIKVSLVQVPLCNPNDTHVILENEEVSTYSPHYIESSDFYNIIQLAADAFNSSDLPNYSAKCCTTPREAYITVTLKDF